MPAKPISKLLITLFVLMALIGFADAAYLTTKHYTDTIPPCSLVSGCETVLTSSYATVGPLPVSLIGAVYYLILFLLALAYFDTKKQILIEIASFFTWAGFLASIGLVTLQFIVIQAICLYCMVSAASSTLLFILGMVILAGLRKHKKNNTI
jgi:uncharacterized membrane protein